MALKAVLRRDLREKRRALHRLRPDAARRIVVVFEAAGVPLPAVAAAYTAMGSELDPDVLKAWLRAQGVKIILPVVIKPDAPMLFREDVAGPKERDALGLSVPPAHAPTMRPQIVFVPLLAFDRKGGRLGQGGGYYDRTLQALRACGPPVRAIGIAYAGQEVEHVPVEPFDQRLDGVLTETAYLPFS